MIKNTKNTLLSKPIGIILPIQDGNTGYFAQSFDTLTQTKNNILNLLNTKRGERRFEPTFGTRLWTLVFEQNIETLQDTAINIISEDIAAWIPNVTVTDVTANLLTNDQITANQDMYILNIAVTFVVNSTKQKDTVILSMNNMSQ